MLACELSAIRRDGGGCVSGRAGLESLMAEIGPLMELAEISWFEAQELWTLGVDEQTVLFADWVEERQSVCLSAEVGKPAAGDAAALHVLLLRYNAQWRETGGVRMALDGADGVIMSVELPAGTLDLPQLQGTLTAFLDMLRAWRELIARPPGGDAKAATGDLDPNLMLRAGFIRG
jgi:hypothetical protein